MDSAPFSGHPLLQVILPATGAALILISLIEVFLTVLYARIGTGIISHFLACLIWRAFRAVSAPFKVKRGVILSFCGPCIIVVVTLTWLSLIAVGGALITWPRLGNSIRADAGQSPTDFFTALYVVGDSMTTVGTSDVTPRTPAFRVFYTLMSLIGISVITLTVTYLLEIYNALQRRNTFAVKLHTASAETGDAAELIAGIGAEGRFDIGYTHLTDIAVEMVGFLESHHFYSVLFYFRFAEPYYGVSRLALITLDMVSLIKSTLRDEKYGWLKESVALAQLWRSSMHLMTLLAVSFLPDGLPEAPDVTEQERDRWRRRYLSARHRLEEAGIETIEDESIGIETYIALRARWDRYIRIFSEHMGQEIENVDPAGECPELSSTRQEFKLRLRSAG